MTEYTPTTDEVRREWATSYYGMTSTFMPDCAEGFDRWLAAHDAEVARAGVEAGLKAAARIVISAPDLSGALEKILSRSESYRKVATDE